MISTLVLFIIILGILVFSHELGHFVAAKRLGVGVEEFGFGFPPRLIGLQRLTSTKQWRLVFGNKERQHTNEKAGGTIYSLNWIPLGGFVRIKGEQGDKREEADSFTSKKIWKRGIILSSGVAMNFIVACLIIALGFMIGLPSLTSTDLPPHATIAQRALQIAEVQKDSPAEAAGLQMGDVIISVDGQQFLTTADFQTYTRPRLNQAMTLAVKRANETMTKEVTPADLNDNGQGIIGTWLIETGVVSYPWYYAIWMGVKTTITLTWQIIVALFELVKNLIVSQHISADVAGPVGIAALTGQVAKLGFIYILQFTALLSINLAIINFVPFPALDGGRVLFLLIEKIRGKPINRRIENLVHNIGFIVLISLVVLVTFRDVARFSDSLKGVFNRIF